MCETAGALIAAQLLRLIALDGPELGWGFVSPSHRPISCTEEPRCHVARLLPPSYVDCLHLTKARPVTAMVLETELQFAGSSNLVVVLGLRKYRSQHGTGQPAHRCRNSTGVRVWSYN